MSIRKGSKIIAGNGAGGSGESITNQNPYSDIRQVYDWIGTLDEYNAQDIDNTHPEWVCFVTDDIDIVLPEDKFDKIATNCITEIPQDIKLEVTDTDIIIKAGSKIYKPNGFEADGTTRHFDVIEITEDVIRNVEFEGLRTVNETQKLYVSYGLINTEEEINCHGITLSNMNSKVGTDETECATHGLYYNTATNKLYTRKKVGEEYLYFEQSLPIAIITRVEVVDEYFHYKAVNNIFNGFGYIANQVFVLPGVKGLVPDGRNEDGSLKNNIVTVSDISFFNTFSGCDYVIHSNGTLHELYNRNWIEQPNKPNSSYRGYWYNTEENRIYRCGVEETVETPVLKAFKIYCERNGDFTNVTELIPYKPFRAADYNEVENQIVEYEDSYRTNCITKIPQDIKFEIDSTDNKLVLKAESKVYIPNGFESDGTTRKFDVRTLQTDYKYDDSNTSPITYACSIQYIKSTNTWTQWRQDLTLWVSGDTAPVNPVNSQIWYDTANNIIKRYLDNQWASGGYALPLGIATFAGHDGVCSSIDQVFNGFGYIGSVLFALPGIEALTPNGRNDDGTLHSTKEKNPSVLIFKTTEETTVNNYIRFRSSELGTGILQYNAEENKNYINNKTTIRKLCVAGMYSKENGKITSIKPKFTMTQADNNELVHNFNDETINGYKTFTKSIERTDALSAGGSISVRMNDTANHGETDLVSYYTSNIIYNRLLSKNTTSGKLAYFDVQVADDGTGRFYWGGDANFDWTSNGSFVTLASLNKSQTGYVKFRNGLIIAWGISGPQNNNSTWTINFPIAFTAAPESVQVGYARGGNAFVPRVTATTTTNFSVSVDIMTSYTVLQTYVRWIAIGY